MMDSSFHRMRNSSTPPPQSRSVRSVDRELRGYHTARPAAAAARDRRQSLPHQERIICYFDLLDMHERASPPSEGARLTQPVTGGPRTCKTCCIQESTVCIITN